MGTCSGVIFYVLFAKIFFSNCRCISAILTMFNEVRKTAYYYLCEKGMDLACQRIGYLTGQGLKNTETNESRNISD